MRDLLISVVLVTVPVQRPNSSRFEFWVAILRALAQFLPGGLGGLSGVGR